jgi:flagellar motor switch protein FliG
MTRLSTRPATASSTRTEASTLRKAAILVISLEEPLAAQLLARLDRAAVEAVTLEMAHLDRVDPDEQRAVMDAFVSEGLKRLQFQFDDLSRLEDRSIQLAFHDEDAALWALALAGASGPLQAKVLAALPQPSGEALRGRLAHFGPFRLADAEAAQAELAEHVRRLHDQGCLTLPDRDGQEEFLV